MTDKEVRQLSRARLVTLLAEVTGENEELKAEIGRLKAEIEKLTVTDEKLERISEMTRQILDRVGVPEQHAQEHAVSGSPEGKDAPSGEEKTVDAVSDEQTAEEGPARTEGDRAVPRPSSEPDWTAVPGAV